MWKSTIHCTNNPGFFPPCKIPNTLMNIYNDHNYGLKTRVDIWTRMNVVMLEHGIFTRCFAVLSVY